MRIQRVIDADTTSCFNFVYSRGRIHIILYDPTTVLQIRMHVQSLIKINVFPDVRTTYGRTDRHMNNNVKYCNNTVMSNKKCLHLSCKQEVDFLAVSEFLSEVIIPTIYSPKRHFSRCLPSSTPNQEVLDGSL